VKRTLTMLFLPVVLVALAGCGEREGAKTSIKEEAPAPATVVLPDSIPGRELVVTLKGDTFMSGELPLFADMFSENGGRASAGGFLTGDLRDAVLDLSALESGTWVPVALQEGSEYLAAVCARTPKIVITPDGLVYPLGAATMDAKGPYVRFEFLDEDWEDVDPKSLNISIAQGSGIREYSVLEDLVVVSGISLEPVMLTLSDGPDTNKVVVFPYVRGASPDLVGYSISGITVGDPLPQTE
jgi:hypothetical protein